TGSTFAKYRRDRITWRNCNGPLVVRRRFRVTGADAARTTRRLRRYIHTTLALVRKSHFSKEATMNVLKVAIDSLSIISDNTHYDYSLTTQSNRPPTSR